MRETKPLGKPGYTDVIGNHVTSADVSLSAYLRLDVTGLITVDLFAVILGKYPGVNGLLRNLMCFFYPVLRMTRPACHWEPGAALSDWTARSSSCRHVPLGFQA